MPLEKQLLIDLSLAKDITRNYENQFFNTIIFNINITSCHPRFINCTFVSCVFNKNSLNIDAFENCQFYDCKFYNLKIIFDKKSNRKLFFSNCIGHEEIALAVTVPAVDEEIDFDREYKKKILEQYWKPGYERAELRKTYNTLFRGIPQQNKEEIVRSIDALIREKILIQRDHCIELNISEINKIKDILERF